jgi:nucleotide-binding universal stress UspA family protein
MDVLGVGSSVPWIGQVLGDDLSTDVLETAYIEGVAKSMWPAAEWEVLRGDDPGERIVEFAKAGRAGLIAIPVPARHRVGTDGGGVALQVVRHAPCPVLALGKAEH